MMGVPWSKLPQLRASAPEFYDSLYSHRSWTGLLVRFVRDPNLSLFSRTIRSAPASARADVAEAEGATPEKWLPGAAGTALSAAPAALPPG